MKKLIFAMLAVWPAFLLNADGSDWLTDMPKALAQAKQERKMVLVDFTGSDWCGWCIKFKKEVLTTSEFVEYAKKNLVLVELDFPKRKELSAAQRTANRNLQAKYQVQGFPTLLLLDGSGREVWRQVGFLKGGPKAFIAALEKAKK